jgi:hypothetical protein
VGETVGSAQLTLDGRVLCTVPLITGETVGRRDYGYELNRIWRLWPSQQDQMAQ